MAPTAYSSGLQKCLAARRGKALGSLDMQLKMGEAGDSRVSRFERLGTARQEKLDGNPGQLGRSWRGGRVELQPRFFIFGSLCQHPQPHVMSLVSPLDRDMGTVIIVGS